MHWKPYRAIADGLHGGPAPPSVEEEASTTKSRREYLSLRRKNVKYHSVFKWVLQWENKG